MRKLLTVCLLFVALSMAWAAPAMAQDPEPPSSAGSSGDLTFRYSGPGAQKCADFNDDDAARTGKEALFGKIIPCLSYNIEVSAEEMASYMVDYMRPIFYSFLVLVIVMHGIMTVQGEGQIGPRTFLLLLKIAAVSTFVESLSFGYGSGLVNVSDLYAVMKGTEDILAGALMFSDTNEGFSCNWQDYWPSDREGHILWAQMDCALGKVMGFALGGSGQPDGAPSMVLAVSVLGMMTGFFFGGTYGLAVFFAGIAFLFSLLSFVVRVGFAYINAYMIVALYVIIAPIFIPLALTRATMPYFTNWTKGLLGAMMMPVIVTAYTIFALLIFDKMLFRDDSMVNQLFEYKHIADAQRHARVVDCGTLVNDQRALIERSQLQGQALPTSERDQLVPSLSSVTKCRVAVTDLEMGRAKLEGMTGDALQDEKKIFIQLMIDMFKLFVLGWIVTTGWKKVSQIMAVLAGGSSVGSMAMSGLTPAERSLQASGASARETMNKKMTDPGDDGNTPGPGGATGSEFISRLPATLGQGASTFLGGVGR